MLLLCRLTLLTAEITGASPDVWLGRAFTIAPPAVADRSLALEIVPAFTMSLAAFKLTLRFDTRLDGPKAEASAGTEVKVAPWRLAIESAVILAVVTFELSETR